MPPGAPASGLMSHVSRLTSYLLRLTFCLLSACAVYTPAPLRPDGQLESFNRRRLDDSGLLAWFDSLGVARPTAGWTPRHLALASSWFRPERSRRLAEVLAADATLLTAGARPQPGVSSDLEYAFTDPQSSSRWGVALAGLFTLELGGKRGARVARARAAALTARAAAIESEWQQANQTYVAALAWERAGSLLQGATEERAALDTIVALVRARYEGGTLTRLDVARAEGELRTAFAAEQAGEREERHARVVVAAELGTPAGALEGIELAEAHRPLCGDPGESRAGLQREALGARWSLRRVAAEYQVAEGDLRVEVANASPDLTLGPGMFFDQGTGKFTLAAALPALPLNRNRGPIAETEARRAVAALRLAEEQEAVLAEVEAALAGCDAARREVAAADSVVIEAERRAKLAAAAYDRGETGRLEVALAGLDLVRVRRMVREARLRQGEAGLALERAVGAWGSRDDGPWPALSLPGVPWRSER